jgi:ribosomal protein S18 acetylase RimI-like enzyme
MSRHTVRAPRPEDAPAIAALLVACDIAEHGASDSTETDVRAIWSWPRFDRERDAWVAVTPEGGIVGYGWVWCRRSCPLLDAGLYTRPGPETATIGSDLLPRLEDRACALAAAFPGEAAALGLACARPNRAKRDLLEARGYTQVRTFFRMERSLEGGIPPPAWPPDFEVAPVRRPDDDASVHATLQDAFSEHYRYVPEPLADWIVRAFGREDFAPELSRIVRRGGEAVAAVTNYVTGHEGWVGMVGVRRAWRRHGLATALLLESFRAFQARGLANAGLGVDSENQDKATRLYERQGMRVTQTHDLFEKRLGSRPGA